MCRTRSSPSSVIGHNPGIHDLTLSLAGAGSEIPPAVAFALLGALEP
jgi:hypothetical protein